MARPHKDLTGQTFGKLKALSSFKKEGQPYYYYNCKCKCGNEKVVRGSALITGRTKSCGCILRENTFNLKHGFARTNFRPAAYNSFLRINKDDLCNRWKGEKGIINFMRDMGEKPANTRLRRINFLKPYSKKNCVWFPYKAKEK